MNGSIEDKKLISWQLPSQSDKRHVKATLRKANRKSAE